MGYNFDRQDTMRWIAGGKQNATQSDCKRDQPCGFVFLEVSKKTNLRVPHISYWTPANILPGSNAHCHGIQVFVARAV